MFNIDADALWQYSLDVYSNTKVKEACLTLQDSMQVNVNLVLSMMYLCSHQKMYEFDDIAKIEEAISATDQVLIKHRQKRRSLKNIDEVKYQQALKQELVLEKAQQLALVNFANTLDFHYVKSAEYLADQLGVLCLSRIVERRKVKRTLVYENTLAQEVLDACESISKYV